MIRVKLYMLDYTLAYFHKDSVTSCHKKKEIRKDCNKEDRDN